MDDPNTPPGPDPILEEVRQFYESHQQGLQRSRRRHRYFYDYLTRILRVRVPAGLRVLDLGCGAGDLLAALEPSQGVGIDVSAPAVRAARERHGSERLRFVEGDASDPAVLAQAGGPFDVILLVNVVTHLTDVQATLERAARRLARAHARAHLQLQPPVAAAPAAGRAARAQVPPATGVVAAARGDQEHAGAGGLRGGARRRPPRPSRSACRSLADLVNRYLGRLPLLDAFSLMFGIVARPAPARTAASRPERPTVSVVIPCRNEAGHIAPLVGSLPALPAGSEFLFVEGHSSDDTEAVIRREIAEPPVAAAAPPQADRAAARATPCAWASPRRGATSC